MESYLLPISFGIIFAIILIYFSVRKPPDSTYNRFLKNISFLPIFFLAIGVFISIAIWDRSLKSLRAESELKMVDRIFIDLAKIIDEYYPKAPKFINSLFLPFRKNKLNFDNTILNTEDDWTTVNFVSLRIFQSWEDYLTISTVDPTGEESWIRTFIPYATSKQLFDIWKVTEYNYEPTTRMFGNLLFEICLGNIPQNSEELQTLTLKFFNSERYDEIKKIRAKLYIK
jgi:hypothetical protein